MSYKTLQEGDLVKHAAGKASGVPRPFGIVTDGGTIREESGPSFMGPTQRDNVVKLTLEARNWYEAEESNPSNGLFGVYRKESANNAKQSLEEDYYATVAAVSSELPDGVVDDLMDDDVTNLAAGLRQMYQCPDCSGSVLNKGGSILLGRQIWGLVSGVTFAKEVTKALLHDRVLEALELIAEQVGDNKLTEVVANSVSGTPLNIMEDPNHGSRLVHSSCQSEPPGVIVTKDDGTLEYQLARSLGGLK